MISKEILELILKEYNIPNTIFQYRRINKYLLQSLKSNTFYFSNPFDFNDPFECRPAQFVAKVKDLKIFKKYLIESGESKQIEYANNIEYNSYTVASLLQINHLRTKEIGVSCFTTKSDDILMWSHYADSHKGICFIIDILEDPKFFQNIRKVKYTKTREKYNFLRKPELVFSFFSKKFVKWKYEDEIRVFKDFQGRHPFKKEIIKGVIFGSDTSTRNKNRVRKLLIDCGYHCEFYQAKTSYTDYSFNIEKID